MVFKNAIWILVLLNTSLAWGEGNLKFTQNKGQWDERIQYRAHIGGVYAFLEQTRITYLLYDRAKVDQLHLSRQTPETLDMHAVWMDLQGARFDNELFAALPFDDYENYFVGNNPARWASEVRHFKEVTYRDAYDGIHLKVYSLPHHMKYDFIVQPHADPSQIRLEYKGADSLWLQNGELCIATSLGLMKEKAPVATQRINGFDQVVACRFKLKGNTVSFDFPNGYNSANELVIDPILVFSTYTGSTADNFGFTATYDEFGNSYTGGVVFNYAGVYPTSPGAFQAAFNGPTASLTDMGISKFNADGSQLLYSTYLGGGTGCEAPHSLIADASGNLYIFGTTGSSDFPVTANAYDATFAGGTPLSPNGSGLNYINGADIVVVKLNPGGTALLGSTYLGGTLNDGLNSQPGLNYFYGDAFRGEIGLSSTGQVYCVSTTLSSTDFPITPGAPQPAFGGGLCDAVLFRLNNDLSALEWSTYWGGLGDDSGFGLQFDSGGNVFIAGGTSSPDLELSPGTIAPVMAGVRDGYVSSFNPATGNMIASTYLGTPQHDQTYFVQLDLNDNVYVLGVTEGGYPITPGVYAIPSSWQFIHKMTSDFTSTIWSTVVGSGTNQSNFSPTAFLVDNCGSLYLSGWGGSVNGLNPPMSNTTGCPVTLDATQSFTDGSDFYLMVLDQDATSLKYATFFGGGVNEHVDGGTSRFDKRGRIYQAVCAGCGGSSAFPTTPGVHSNTNNSSNCNLALFKYDLRLVEPVAEFTLDTVNCDLPAQVQFTNQSPQGFNYFWNFGDGSPIFSGYNVLHNYTSPGIYDVEMVVDDPFDCFINDTAFYPLYIPTPPVIQLVVPDTVCPGEDVQLNVIGDSVYVYAWQSANPLSNSTSSNPLALSANTSFWAGVTVIDTSGCQITDSLFVTVDQGFSVFAGFQIIYDVCALPNPVLFLNTSQNAVNFQWDFGDGSAIGVDENPLQIYSQPGAYDVQLIAIDSAACNVADTLVQSLMVIAPPVVNAEDPPAVCPGESIVLAASGQQHYVYAWSPFTQVSSPADSVTQAFPQTSAWFVVTVTDTTGCTDQDSVWVEIHPLQNVSAGNDLLIGIGETGVFQTNIPEGASISWYPDHGLSCDTCPEPVVDPSFNLSYILTVTDTNGCIYSDTVDVLIESSIYVPNAFTPNGDLINDVFQPIVRALLEYELFIYDRWGNLLFRSDDPTNFWDGTFNGFKSPIDVYVWKIKYVTSFEPGIYREKVGHVTLVR